MVGSKPATWISTHSPLPATFHTHFPSLINMYSDSTVATIEKTLILLGRDHPEQEGSSPEKIQTIAEQAVPEIMQARRYMG